MIDCTPKQQKFLLLLKNSGLKRLNLLEGSVSSGKTWISLIAWALWVWGMPQDKLYMMCAKSLTTLKRNCLILLQELVGEDDFQFSVSAKEGYLFGRRILFEGANDARAESKIRGMTLQGAYCDELTQFPEDFFTMLLSRLRLPGAKLIATTNPDSPNHWLMKRYIERADELDFLDVKFTIDDNTTLPADYVENIKKEYSGVFYDRFILGLWKVAEGLVYPDFSVEKNATDKTPWLDGNGTTKPGTRFYISIDYGIVNPFSAGLWAVYRGVAYRWREYYYVGREHERGQRRDDEGHYAEIEKLAGGLAVELIVIDPSASSFVETIYRHGKYSVINAVNDVVPGIATVMQLLNGGRVKINTGCKDCIEEFQTYSWDKDNNGTVEEVLKENDHAMDDTRYFCHTILRSEFGWLDWG